MNISNSQVNRLRHFVRAGLRSLFRPEPQTAVEWADANYYLPKESAYQEGRWETLPFQRAIMNAMGSDYIREVNVVKSARVGYSKMLLGVYAYFIEHKQRNTLIWLPTDGDAENFMKTHVEPTIRDIPSLLALAPWYGKKHRDNTLTMKRFTNGRGFWCLGGKAAKTTVKSRWMWRVMMNLLPLMMILNRKALRRSWAISVLKARSGQSPFVAPRPK